MLVYKVLTRQWCYWKIIKIWHRPNQLGKGKAKEKEEEEIYDINAVVIFSAQKLKQLQKLL